ncbi:MAG: isochorismatase family protein [Bacteroidota bacterium]
MKNKQKIAIRLICIFLGLISVHNKAFSQERYLIVLDIQEFTKKDTQLDSSVMAMIQNANFVISHFSAGKVIYIKAAGKALSITSKGFSVDTLPAPGFARTLSIVSDNIFLKIEGDAFTSAELIQFLESRKAREIVLVGLMAEKCIYDTALGGKERGYDITIVPEGIVGMTPKKKDKAIQKMKEKGIKFIPISEITEAP